MSIFGKMMTAKATPANIELARATALYYAKKEGEKAAKRAKRKGTSVEVEINNANFSFAGEAPQPENYEPMSDEEIKKAQKNINNQPTQKKAEPEKKQENKKADNQQFKKEAPKADKKTNEQLKAEKKEEKTETKAEQKGMSDEEIKKAHEAINSTPETKPEEKKEAPQAAKEIVADVITPEGKQVVPTAAKEITGASIVQNFMNAPRPDTKVPISQMNGSSFIQKPQAQAVVLPQQNDGVEPIEKVRAFLAQNPQIAPPVSPINGGAKKKAKELKQSVSFIQGLHKNVDDIELTCLLNLVKGPWLRNLMRQENAVGVNNPKLVEVPVSQYDNTGDYNYAFEIDLKGTSKKVLVILFQSVPEFTNGMWISKQTSFVTRKKNAKPDDNKAPEVANQQ